MLKDLVWANIQAVKTFLAFKESEVTHLWEI
jgi:hypothetical protein